VVPSASFRRWTWPFDDANVVDDEGGVEVDAGANVDAEVGVEVTVEDGGTSVDTTILGGAVSDAVVGRREGSGRKEEGDRKERRH
jgi:hypothetical protein